MAKLNVKAYSEKGKVKSVSGNERITLGLNRGNRNIATIDYNEESIRIWYDGNRYWSADIKEISKGNKQKDKCYKCKSADEGLTEQDNGKLACDNCYS